MTLLIAYGYRHYLSMKDEAQKAIWMLAPNIKGPLPTPEDFVGYYIDGHIFSKEEKEEYLMEKYSKKRGEIVSEEQSKSLY